MASEENQTVKDVAERTAEHHREFLEEHIDPDTGLLDILLRNGPLSNRESIQIKHCKTFIDRNVELLNCILTKHKCDRLVTALREAEQTHIVNYLNESGEYKTEIGGDWPLTEKEVSILNTNHGSLVDLLECDELLGLLYSSKVINKRQMESISSKPTSHEKNEALLECLQRRSLRDYLQTIKCLHQTRQSHIAEILEEGGAVVRVHVQLGGGDVDQTEDELISRFEAFLLSKPAEERSRIMEGLRIIAAEKGHSVVLYFYCKTMTELVDLREMQISGKLKTLIERLFSQLLCPAQYSEVTVDNLKSVVESVFTQLLHRSQIANLTANLSESEYKKCRSIFPGDIEVRAIVDFDPKQMSGREKVELKEILQRRRRKTSGPCNSSASEDYVKSSAEESEEPVAKDSPRQEKQLNAEGSGHSEISELLDEGRDSDLVGDVGEEKSNQYKETGNQEEAIQTEDLGVALLEQERITDQGDLRTKSGSDKSFASEDDLELEQEDRRSTSSDSNESYYSDDDVNPCATTLTFKREDKMKTIPPANIGDIVGWWRVRHLESGQIGFIQRNRVVIDLAAEDQPVKTTINELPLELLDIVLQKSYLLYALNKQQSTEKRDEFLLKRLLSVDVCWSQRLVKERFKKTIWRHLSEFYEELRRGIAIFRSNLSYLEQNIQPKGLISRLRSADCLPDVETRLLCRQTLHQSTKKLFRRNNNPDLLHGMRSLYDEKHSDFIRCLRKSKQKLIARVAENGGVSLKATILIRVSPKKLDQRLNDFRDKTKPRSHQMDKLISQLKDDDIEILSCLPDRQTVVWIWCQSQTGLEKIQKLTESSSILDVFISLIFPLSSPEINKTTSVSICREQFKKSCVVCLFIVNFNKRLKIEEHERVMGVTKLRNEIYVLCNLSVIRVFEDRNPFRLQKEIEIKEMKFPGDIRSSEKENCLYVTDSFGKCVWKITRETDDKHKIIKWVTIDYVPLTLSMSSDGQLLVVSFDSSILRIYGSDAELLRSIELTRHIKKPIHAVETSIGNFIVLHWLMKEEEKKKIWLSGSDIWEVTADGQMVIRCFIPSNEIQKLKDSFYLSLDSDDRVFAADYANYRVILLDSNLKWNRILSQATDEDEEIVSYRLCYDEEMKQLIVGFDGKGVDIYTMNRK